jgi:transketolase
LYTQLFYSGYGLEMHDLKTFRTWGSLTPGHPEFGHTAGVEMTTGPLGQGVATAVGMAMAARYERGLLDPNAAPGSSLFDHSIWVICSDGDLQEGVSAEACSLAGTQELGNLNIIYDDNQISLKVILTTPSLKMSLCAIALMAGMSSMSLPAAMGM